MQLYERGEVTEMAIHPDEASAAEALRRTLLGGDRDGPSLTAEEQEALGRRMQQKAQETPARLRAKRADG